MAAYHDVIHEKDKNIRYLGRMVGGLLLALCLAIWGWHNASKDITVHYPPNMTLATTMKAGTVPEETVYAFVPLMLQQLNLWENSGDKDYEDNRFRLRQFLTEGYQRQIRDEIEAGLKRGTLSGVKRRMQILPSSFYNDEAVQPIGNHWLVWIDVELTDSVNNVPVNASVRRLGVRVVRYDINRDANPWQLAIDGIEHDVPLLSEKDARRIQAEAGGTRS